MKQIYGRGGWSCALALLGVMGWCPAAEHWFVATVAGQPMATMHTEEHPTADGGMDLSSELVLAIRRSMPGQPELRMEMRENRFQHQSHDGQITAFRCDSDENGSVTVANGTVSAASDGSLQVTATVARLGRTRSLTIPVPAGQSLLGDQAGQQVMRRIAAVPGSVERLRGVELVGNDVVLVTTTVTGRGVADGVATVDAIADVAPLPMRLRLDATGTLVGMDIQMGFLRLEMRPSDGPVALPGLDLPPTGLVQAQGPKPTGEGPNRLRLPPGPALEADPFQAEEGSVVTVTASAGPMTLDAAERGRWCAAGPQFELDDPELRRWVEAQVQGVVGDAQRAERLRLAVRSHITTKDLSKGDGSALETFRNHTGDCTEHATLLCAALRIAGIPARVAVGLVYVPGMGWVGHAWNLAWVEEGAGGRWIHLDSAYPGISRARYLALAHADDQAVGGSMITALNRVMGKPLVVEEQKIHADK